jgi:hypothetical protein
VSIYGVLPPRTSLKSPTGFYSKLKEDHEHMQAEIVWSTEFEVWAAVAMGRGDEANLPAYSTTSSNSSPRSIEDGSDNNDDGTAFWEKLIKASNAVDSGLTVEVPSVPSVHSTVDDTGKVSLISEVKPTMCSDDSFGKTPPKEYETGK